MLTIRDRVLRVLIGATSRLTAWLYTLQRVPVWRSFDGRVTPITEMTDSHLRNTLLMLVRQSVKENSELPLIYAALLREQTRRYAAQQATEPRDWPSC